MFIEGLRTVLCTYRTLFTFINFNLIHRSLREIERMNYDLAADNDSEQSQSQSIELDINAYKELFAEDYCRNLKLDLQSQVAFIEKLEEKTANVTDLSQFVDFCAAEYPGLNLFLPKLTGLNQDTYFFDATEFCTVFAEAITEIKDAEVDIGQPIVGPDSVEAKIVKPEPFGLQDYAKALQIVAHELFLEKQRLIMRNNCHNSAFMSLKTDDITFCTNQLDSQLDMTLWSDGT